MSCKRYMVGILCACTVAVLPTFGQNRYFSDWPEGADPATLGNRVAQHLVEALPETAVVTYPEVCLWYGSLAFADASGNAQLRSSLQNRMQALLQSGKQYIPDRQHVDFEIFGAVPLQIYIEDHDPAMRALGLRFADRQWANPQPDGLSGETRYWIDDMYMITILQLQAWRATGDRRYLDRAAKEMISYLNKVQQPNGLFLHATDAPFYWGRGNGWVAAGMTEMLKSMPADDPDRSRILDSYRRMMMELVHDQNPDGMWRQLLDEPDAWEESSGSGMFTFALIEGVRNGRLDEASYGPVARKAWIALAGFVDQNANVTNVCAGTNKGSPAAYYLARPRRTGDYHGQAPVMWAASALLEK